MNRRVVAGLSALLIIFQMVAVPFVSAMSQDTPGHDCANAGAVHPWHPDDGCKDGRAPGHAGATQHHARSGHQCHCVHAVAYTPIIGAPLWFAAMQPESERIAARLAGPAFSAPLFDFLRPPD